MNNKKELTKPITFRLTETMYGNIIAEVERLNLRKMSDVVRKAVAEYFDNHKKEIEGEKK